VKSKLKPDKLRLSAIPNEFDLKKYDVCKNWGVEEWSKAISYRAYFRNDWNISIRKNFDVEDISEVYESFKILASQLLKEPFFDAYISHRVGKEVYIKDQSVADLFHDAEDERLACSPWRADYHKWLEIDYFSLHNTDTNKELVERIENTPTWIMKREEWGGTGFATIHVNLRGVNTEIVKDFQAWLKATKKKMNLPNVPTQFDSEIFSDWCRKCVLPCFDLQLYRRIHNVNFKLIDIAQALFPDSNSLIEDIRSEDSIRKTIIPNARRVVSWEMGAALREALKK
jgi:hypothetical protein